MVWDAETTTIKLNIRKMGCSLVHIHRTVRMSENIFRDARFCSQYEEIRYSRFTYMYNYIIERVGEIL